MNNDSYFKEAVELLEQILSIPSLSRNEKDRADFLVAWLEERGMKVNREQNNLWCIAPEYSAQRPTILLNSHMDTVKPVDGWEYKPYQATIEGDRMYGLGSNDAGASLCCLIQAFRILSTLPQSYNLILGLSAEEEVTGKNGIDALLPQLPPIAFGVVGEPTNMHPAIAEKGLMVLDCTAHGRAGHAARNEGENAIYKAMRDIEWFRTKNFQEQSNFLGPVKMTVTQINAGTQHNVVPDTCQFVVDVRINEFFSPESLFEKIKAEVQCEVKPRSFRLNSSRIELDHPAVVACLECGRVPYGSPTLSDQARMPFTTLKLGPGESSRSHTANEFIVLEEIREGISLYIRILDGLVLS
jgi:Acetylornithine deacetylase/Succinyl-diaminopimelate desuccinylase and related deacylases